MSIRTLFLWNRGGTKKKYKMNLKDWFSQVRYIVDDYTYVWDLIRLFLE